LGNQTRPGHGPKETSMTEGIRTVVGFDVGDLWSHHYVVDHSTGEVVMEGRVATTRKALERFFGSLERSRVALEVGTHSRWIQSLLLRLGHEAVVANARELQFIWKSHNKHDRVDARKLARVARLDPSLLHPVRHRSLETHQDLAVLRTRDQMVQVRTRLIVMVRGMVKAAGERLPSCHTSRFAEKMKDLVPEGLRSAIEPVLRVIAELSRSIKECDERVEALVTDRHPEARALRKVPGIGTLTALAFVLVLEDPHRFRKSREVGPALGLVPRRDQSGGSDKSLRITKCGDGMLRRLLVEAAQHILREQGQDTDLRRWGLALVRRNGVGVGKKRAVVAVARKLSVLLHHLWVTQEEYRPLRDAA